MKRNKRRPRLKVTADGKGMAGHAGARLLADMADAVGLTDGLSAAMSSTRQRRSAHDPGDVLVDLAVMLADGGTHLSHLRTLRDQPELFGSVASDPTGFRVVDSIDDKRLGAIREARATARRVAWEAGADPGFYVMDFDATLLTAHSDKEQAAPNYKRGYGFHPLECYLDGTNEALAAILRPGNAGANTAADHIEVLNLALAQLPVAPRTEDNPDGVPMLARADSAGATHDFLNALRKEGIEFSVGFDLTAEVARAAVSVPEEAWVPAVAQDGIEEREHAEVAELTGLVDLSSWPEGTRLICRREDPHPGAQLTFTDMEGHRFQCFICDSTDPDLAYLEARHRGHARVEDRIRCGKDTGMANLPFHAFANNEVWLELVLVACDLTAWCQRLCLDGEHARSEPRTLRYMLWHTAGRLVHTGRRNILRLQENWPWAEDLAQAFARLETLPLRGG